MIASEFSNSSLIDAGRQILRRAQELLDANQSFAVETTLSGHTYLRMMADAKRRGYEVSLIFAGTERIEINLDRVAQRVLFGGHEVPEADQRRRYPRSMKNLQKALELADNAILFDNSGDSHHTIAVKDANGITMYGELPAWAAFLKTT
jgi:predicted ABC-type ATPase